MFSSPWFVDYAVDYTFTEFWENRLMIWAYLTGYFAFMHAIGTLTIHNLLTTPPRVVQKLANELSKLDMFVAASAGKNKAMASSPETSKQTAEASVAGASERTLHGPASGVTVYFVLLVSMCSLQVTELARL